MTPQAGNNLMETALRRLILEFKPDGTVDARVLYRTKDGPNPGTVRRRREAEQLARDGLTAALEALDSGETEQLGTSGFEVREDTLGLVPLRPEDTRKGEASPFLPNRSNNVKQQR